MKKRTHHLKYIVAGAVAMVLMLIRLTGFIVSTAGGGNINSSASSDQKIWNTGFVTMSRETNLGGYWKLRFKSATRGYIKESKLKVEDPEREVLYGDIHCESVPEGASLTLWIVQDDKSESIDVTNLSEPLEYSLEYFDEGKIRIRLEIDGVEDVASEIYVK